MRSLRVVLLQSADLGFERIQFLCEFFDPADNFVFLK
jgi:hypothetical protein